MTKIDSLLSQALRKRAQIPHDVLEPLIQEAQTANQPLLSLLIARQILSEEEALKILADELRLSYVELKAQNIDKSLIAKVPLRIASYYKFIPLALHERTLTIAVSYPLDIKTQDEVRTQLGYAIDMVLASSRDIADMLTTYYGLAADTLRRISSEAAHKDDALAEAGTEASYEAIEDIEKLVGDASVIKLVNQIILEGWKKRATDIHIEPYRQSVVLRYRVDGLLYDAPLPSEMKGFLNAIISRIKVMSNLNIVERRVPQDGRAIVKVQDQMLDLRISTIPTAFGESLVIRILPAQMLFSLEKLGLPKNHLQAFETLIQKPHGIIFVTGPTGSGKTTTLYACLSRINTREKKIISIEDPVEYEMQGITQIQVQPEVGLDFARGLRSILRHDPDVIMVGEVRDLETAEIAIRVALTGHLVFSTLHTNDAASGITRLVDIGVEPYLVSSSVEAFIAQRLLRVLCADCKYEDTRAPLELRELIAKDLRISVQEVKVYRAKGCNNCNGTGFFGRIAIYEILLADETIKDLILKKTPSNQIKKVALAQGMRTLRQDGWQKVIAGITTPEEVMKVTPAQELKAVKEEPAGGSGVLPSEAVAQQKDTERRVYSRLDAKVTIRYKVFQSPEEAKKQFSHYEHLSTTKNISAGGLLFVSFEPLPVGSLIELIIDLPDDEKPIECLAKVVRVEENGEQKNYLVAACFLDIASAQRVRLNKHIKEE
ncbi:MAG: hypothetical protein A2Y00_02355 [Omnitrophica WOR_2 bacterium GWF2_43_52]|nr:MAG: hypothetical protein A2Y00_02355 [Omnitrophica WOR_2 bacterium GWF2_43_52]HAH21288.1 hypothetical protein [Candidatus Omnitrophota bacterium]HBG63900.1 hypothetical protein [Candidatus Omnitrophota bacterium]HCD38611.1 hypothetical protein [Candidatus Omnitrophota bacterium]